MSYESPIKVIYDDFVKEVTRKFDDTVIAACQNVNIVVDKEELAKALAYDREQYEKGFKDGAESHLRDTRWTPVSEKLPEESDDYLVTIYFGWSGIHTTECVYFNIETSEWSFHGRYDEDFLAENEITAWMELPKPYGVEHDD